MSLADADASLLSRVPSGFQVWLLKMTCAFSLMAKGVAQYVRIKERDKREALMPPRMPISC